MGARAGRAAAGLAIVVGVAAGLGNPTAVGAPSSRAVAPPDLAAHGWMWPSAAFRIEHPFVAPAHRYGAGHRGIDLRLVGDPGLRAPANGVVAFVGTVVDRGVLTIDHGDGLVTTLEPVTSDRMPGQEVGRGDPVATLSAGGHAEPGTVHFGVRLHGEYINPLLLLGGVPRAVLLPCC